MDTQVSISKIRKSLLDSRNTLLESIDSFREEIHKYELANPDSDDLAQVYTLRQQNFSYINEAEEKLKRIESALKRIEQGTYGKCQRCGKEIPPERLELIPYVETCISCQERREQYS